MSMTEPLSIYQQVKRTGGSGRGVSYWAVPAMCGRKRRLMSEHPEVDPIVDRTALDLGTYYHFLKEIWLKGEMPEDVVIDADPVQDIEWGEALRLFNWHREHFPRDYWGQIVAVELKMPASEDHAKMIKKHFGHEEVTGACDLVVLMSQDDIDRVELDRGIKLNGPGIYIIDHKTSGSRRSEMDARSNYTSSMQCLMYMFLLNLAFSQPVKGMIFDVLVKHKNLRRYDEGKNGSSVQTFAAFPREEDGDVVKAAMAYGRLQREQNFANPFACYDYGRECVYLSRGLCGRY
jgi:hypothetical protein